MHIDTSLSRVDARLHIIAGAALLAVFILCYHETLVWMYGRFTGADSNYSHGFLIPVVSAFLIWRERDELRNRKVEPSMWGAVLVGFALLLHLLGSIFYVFSVSGFSILFLVLGVCLFIFGQNITRVIFFPLAFLVFMFPLPMAFIEIVAYPMKMVVAQAGTGLARLAGIPILREGFLISIPSGELVIGNPCSGLRSLIAFLALGAVFAYVTDLSAVRKVLLFLSAVPVALISNIVRVPILIFLEHFFGLNAASPDSPWHMASGLFTFFVALMLLLFMARCLRWR